METVVRCQKSGLASEVDNQQGDLPPPTTAAAAAESRRSSSMHAYPAPMPATLYAGCSLLPLLLLNQASDLIIQAARHPSTNACLPQRQNNLLRPT